MQISKLMRLDDNESEEWIIGHAPVKEECPTFRIMLLLLF